MLRKYVEIGKT